MTSNSILQPDFEAVVRNCNITLPEGKIFCSVLTLVNCPDSFNTENHFLVGQLLHMKACQNESSFALNSTSTASRFRGGNNIYQSYKKPKSTASYRRMFFFMDLLSNGDCFVIFEKDKNDEMSYWQDLNARANIRVGDIMLITEPNQIQNTIAGSLNVVTTDRAFIPINIPKPIVAYMPPIVENDKFAGFYLKNKTIKVVNITSINTNCNGSFCDRLFPDITPCGCYQNNSARGYNANHVLKLQVSFDTGMAGSEVPPITTTSLRLTELLFTRPIPNSITRKGHVLQKLDSIRLALRSLVDFVNEDGGWSISGWFRPSTVSEVGTGGEVLSDTFGLHISYIYPTCEDIINEEEFKNLQKDPNMFFFS
jgi:hypothetical protein